MKNFDKKIGFIGGGNMAEGIIRGFISENKCPKQQIYVFDVLPNRMDFLTEEYGIVSAPNIKKLIKNVDILFLAVRPQDATSVLTEISLHIKNREMLIISICAGITIQTVSNHVGSNQRIARVMPNVLIEAKEGYSGICLSNNITEEDKTQLSNLFHAIGQTLFIEENMFDVFTAFSCAGPAYVLQCISGLIDAGVHSGFSRDNSRNIVLKNFIGSAKMLELTNKHPFEIIDTMTSPNGVTIEGIKSLNSAGLTGILMECVAKAVDKTKELKK